MRLPVLLCAGGTSTTTTLWPKTENQFGHTGRIPAERAHLAEAHPDPEVGSRGVHRAFILPVDTIAKMEEATGIDRRAGRMQSESQLAAEALRIAIQEATRRNGGSLPVAPKRLPNKPTPDPVGEFHQGMCRVYLKPYMQCLCAMRCFQREQDFASPTGWEVREEEVPMKVIGMIRPHEVKEIETEDADYDQAREKLLAIIPAGYTLLNVRRGS